MAQRAWGHFFDWMDAVNSGAQHFLLVEYAAQHSVDHARFENVSLWVRDASKLHFASWLQMHDIDELAFSPGEQRDGGSPLYYVAFCGLYDLTERLIVNHPEHVNAFSSRIVAPLPVALHGRHFQVADPLYQQGAAVDVQVLCERTPLHRVSMSGDIDVTRWLLNHSADVHARRDTNDRSPLHLAAVNGQPEVVQVLRCHKADVNSRSKASNPPLHDAASEYSVEKATTDVRRLLEHGANPNTHDSNSTLLHSA